LIGEHQNSLRRLAVKAFTTYAWQDRIISQRTIAAGDYDAITCQRIYEADRYLRSHRYWIEDL
jgi:hypothetical protein